GADAANHLVAISFLERLNVLRNIESSDPLFKTDWAKCRQMRGRGWTDESGQVKAPPIGYLSDLHHDDCYRGYNIDQYIKSHQGQLKALPMEPIDDGWSEFVEKSTGGVANSK